MKLSIIIPTKERGDVFDKTLRGAVTAIDGLEAEIVVVNDSKSGQPAIPPDFLHVRLVNNPKQGVASARNLGARESTGSLLLFLDNDILISAGSVLQVLRVHQQKQHIALNLNWVYPPVMMESLHRSSFGRFLEANQMTTFKGWYSDSSWKDNALFPSLSVASFHLSLSRADFEKSGGYDEQFPHAGFEDYDFPLRLKQAGLSFFIDTRVTVFHQEEDRTDLRTWLSSQERRAATRSVAVRLGHKELELSYPRLKRSLLYMVLTFSPLIIAMLSWIRNIRLLDSPYFALVGALQAASIYKGYCMSQEK